MSKKITATLLVLLFSSGFALAQDRNIAAGLHLYGAAYSDDDGLDSEWGVHARVRLNSFIGMEGQVNFSSLEAGIAARTIPVQLSALVYPFKSKFVRPYGLAGISYSRYSLDFTNPDSERQTDMLFHLGAGIEVPIHQNFEFYIDARYYDLGRSEIDFSEIGYGEDDWKTSVGFSFRF